MCGKTTVLGFRFWLAQQRSANVDLHVTVNARLRQEDKKKTLRARLYWHYSSRLNGNTRFLLYTIIAGEVCHTCVGPKALGPRKLAGSGELGDDAIVEVGFHYLSKSYFTLVAFLSSSSVQDLSCQCQP